MPTNDFLAFAIGVGANVDTQSAYAARTSIITNGQVAGVVPGVLLNKINRQSSVIANVVAQYICDLSGLDALDNGAPSTLLANLKTAIAAQIDAQSGNYAIDTGTANAYVVALSPPITAWPDGLTFRFRVTHTNTGASTVNAGPGAVALNNNINAPLVANDLLVGTIVTATYVAALGNCVVNTVVASQALTKTQADLLYAPIGSSSAQGVRQSINSGPVDANGFFTPGGSTGGTSVTTTGISPSAPLVLNAAAGYGATGSLADRVGVSTANLAFTGLTTNGTMYLFGNLAANGTITPGADSIAPNYQRGGTFSIASGQFTYNANAKNQTVGNGTTAVQSYRVYLGEVTVAGGVVTALTWYRINNKFDSVPFVNPNVSGSITNINSNLGLPLNMLKRPTALATTPTSVDGWDAGVTYEFSAGNTAYVNPVYVRGRNLVALQAGSSASNGFYYESAASPGATVVLPSTAMITVHLEGDL